MAETTTRAGKAAANGTATPLPVESNGGGNSAAELRADVRRVRTRR